MSILDFWNIFLFLMRKVLILLLSLFIFSVCNLNFLSQIIRYPPEVWAVILRFLLPLDLLMMSCCLKRFYFLIRQDQKYRERLELSRRLLLNSVKMEQFILVETENFFRKIYGVDSDLLYIFKKEVIPYIVENLLPFRIYNHLLFCNRDEFNPRCLCNRSFLSRCDKVF